MPGTGRNHPNFESFWPYKMLVALLYAQDPDLFVRTGDNHVTVFLGPLAKKYRLYANDHRKHLKQLEDLDYIYDVTFKRNVCTLKVRPPLLSIIPSLGEVVPALIAFQLNRTEDNRSNLLGELDKLT